MDQNLEATESGLILPVACLQMTYRDGVVHS